MTSSMSTPRILPAHLHAFAPNASSHNTVRMLGTIAHVNGDQATLNCGTDSVEILLNRYVLLPQSFLIPDVTSTRYTNSSRAEIPTSLLTPCTRSSAKSQIQTAATDSLSES